MSRRRNRGKPLGPAQPIPNPERAVIDPAKLRDYLLSRSHPVGRFKAAYFASLGYTQERWQELEADIRRQLGKNDVVQVEETAYGRKFVVRGTLEAPAGREVEFVSVWIVELGENFPRFVTAYPGVRR